MVDSVSALLQNAGDETFQFGYIRNCCLPYL